MINTCQQTFQQPIQQTTTSMTTHRNTRRHYRRASVVAINPTYFNWLMHSSTGLFDIIICSLQDQQSDQCRDCWTRWTRGTCETRDISTSKFCSSLVATIAENRLLTPDSLRRQLHHPEKLGLLGQQRCPRHPHYCYYPRETTKRFEKQNSSSSSSFGRGYGQRCFVGR